MTGQEKALRIFKSFSEYILKELKQEKISSTKGYRYEILDQGLKDIRGAYFIISVRSNEHSSDLPDPIIFKFWERTGLIEKP